MTAALALALALTPKLAQHCTITSPASAMTGAPILGRQCARLVMCVGGMAWRRFRSVHSAIVTLLFLVSACAFAGPAVATAAAGPAFNAARVAQDSGTLRIGSKRFTESYLLAELLAQQAAPALTTPPDIRQGLGNTAIVFEALRSGAIDLYPEYTGTIAREILKQPDAAGDLGALNAALAPMGFGVAIPLGFQNGYALAMRGDDAAKNHIAALSDLANHPDLRLGLSNEFLGRADGWPGLARRYRLPQQPRALDHGLAYAALTGRQVDVIDIYTTDARIAELGLAVLKDADGYFPRYDAVVLYRLDVPRRFPHAWAAMMELRGQIDETAMIAMNARAERQGGGFHAIARDFLATHGRNPLVASAGVAPVGASTTAPTPAIGRSGSATRAAGGGVGTGAAVGVESSVQPSEPSAFRGFLHQLFGPDLARLTRQHLVLVAVSVALAALGAIPLAFWVQHRPRWRGFALGAASLMQTVPSLALLAVLISLTGVIGTVPALLALTAYAVLPILRNTATALSEIPPGLRMAAMALGMRPSQQRRWVELPLALPVILAGVRTATSIAIGTATIAAFIGAGGYGERIVTGLALNDRGLLLAGALPAAALALLSEAGFVGLQRWLLRR